MKNNNSQSWIIQSTRSVTDFKLKQVLNYRYLIYCLVHRDITASYKQTILGPLWLLIQPLLTVTCDFERWLARILGKADPYLPAEPKPENFNAFQKIGDHSFQLKCIEKISKSLSPDEGKTIILVSHNSENIKSLCHREIKLINRQLSCR